MPRKSLTELIEARRGEDDPGSSERFVGLQVDVYAEDADGKRTDERLARIGGIWDRRRKDWGAVDASGAVVAWEVPEARVISVHPGQLEFFRWWLTWLDAYLRGDEIPEADRIYSVLLGGGMRAGKTWIAVLPCVLFAMAVPGSIVWIVSPTDKDHEEIEDLLRAIMPAGWFSALGAPWFRYRLPNGSKIVLRSSHRPEALKKGDADFVLINEAQQQPEKTLAICRARIAAAGGQVLVAANPPDQPQGQWVGDFAADAQAGLRQAKFFHLDPLDNPHIDKGPLLAMRAEFDEHTFDTEVRGLFLGAKNAVIYNWSRTENEIAPPASGDITAEVTQHFEGRPYDRVVSVDVQRHPFMASCEWRFYENPRAQIGPARIAWCWMWGVSELFLKGADEEALAVAWLESGWNPDRTLVVCDASAEWQFAERDPARLKALRDRVKGRGSFDIFRRYGFTVVKPDRSMEKNPEVLERVRATTSRIKTAVPNEHGQHFYFVSPVCRETARAIRNWSNKNGLPMRVSQWAHGGDVATYPVQRFFPRRDERVTTEVEVVKRFEGSSKMRGW
jgi:hypothetical protein